MLRMRKRLILLTTRRKVRIRIFDRTERGEWLLERDRKEEEIQEAINIRKLLCLVVDLEALLREQVYACQ